MAFFSTIFSEAVFFALYMFVCLALMKPRFPLGMRVTVYGAILLCSCGAAAALSQSVSIMAALTLLPLIAYLPFSVCVYILSEGGIFETAAACSVGALASMIVKTVDKMLATLYTVWSPDIGGVAIDTISLVIVFALAAAAAFVVFRFIRKPFGVCAGSDIKNRLLVLVPIVTMFLLIFFNFNSTTSILFSIMTLVVAVSFFVITAWLFGYNAKIIEVTEKERALSESLSLQRENFERISQSVEAGRHYRHDMRHHLKVLAGMAQQNNSNEILEYIGELNEIGELSTPEMFCKNSAVNAVLSEYIIRAKDIGCRTEHKIYIPEELPFELPDVCIILSNAIENALNACEKCPEDKRYIDLLADFSDDRKLKISVRNSYADIVDINAEGLPVVEARDGHGIGLYGVKKVVEKYNGFICCACENGEFLFCAEIFCDPEGSMKNDGNTGHGSKHSKALPAVLTLLICAVGLLNFSPAAASALSETLSVDIKTISYGWGDNDLSIRYPEFGGDNSNKPNQAIKDFIAEARDIFQQYAVQKYEGYVAEDAGYRIHMNNRTYLSARFYATVNLGGSMEYSRCVTIDKQSGEVLALSDLFDEDYDYIGEISAEVLRQMEFRVQYEEADYFIPGGIWSDDECFKEISPDQEFYLNSDGLLVIVFEEYTVAPGKEGSPEFVMPDEIFRFAVV
ncbi:MAG: GHKL domain-containing protein [Oscillospiraceae bacterium]|nr:GHKL domain-containing protein [Oscillospiraceae bacterium]